MASSDLAPGERGRHLHVLLDEQTFDELNEVIPWGNKRRVISSLVKGLVSLLKTPRGSMYLGLFIKDEITFEDLIIMSTTPDKHGNNTNAVS